MPKSQEPLVSLQNSVVLQIKAGFQLSQFSPTGRNWVSQTHFNIWFFSATTAQPYTRHTLLYNLNFFRPDQCDCSQRGSLSISTRTHIIYFKVILSVEIDMDLFMKPGSKQAANTNFSHAFTFIQAHN